MTMLDTLRLYDQIVTVGELLIAIGLSTGAVVLASYLMGRWHV